MDHTGVNEKKTICKFVAMHSLQQQQQQPQLQPDHFSFRVLSSPSSKDISVAEDVAVVVVVVVAEQLHSHTLYDALSIIYARPYEFDSHHLNKYKSLL